MPTLVYAKDMTPGNSYRGMPDYGPEELDGVVFTPLVTVSYHPECCFGTVPTADDLALIQVHYDAWAYPLPQSTSFAPHDYVEELNMPEDWN